MAKQSLYEYTEKKLLGRYILRRGEPEINLLRITEVYPNIFAKAVRVHFRNNQTLHANLRFPSYFLSGGGVDKSDFEDYLILDEKEAKRVLAKIGRLEGIV